MTSERARLRKRDLRGEVLTRLENHTELVNLLEDVGSGADAIMPAFNLKRYRYDNKQPDPPDVALAVSVVTSSSERENAMERVNVTIQVELEFRKGIRPSIGVLPWTDAVLDEVEAVLTSHVPDWHAEGVTGGTPEPLWNEDRNRYVSVTRFDVQSINR